MLGLQEERMLLMEEGVMADSGKGVCLSWDYTSSR